MAEYIKKQDALSVFEKAEYLEDAYYSLLEMPAVDVAPVVRCRECEHYDIGTCYHDKMRGHDAEPDDYCSYGVRREEA